MLVNFMCLAVKLATATGMSAVGTCSHYNTNLIIDSIGCAVIFLQLAVFIHNSMDHRTACTPELRHFKVWEAGVSPAEWVPAMVIFT